MVKKSFRVTIYFDLHQVSSPGVWLCPKGQVFLSVSLFRCIENTKQVDPVFPMKIHERFVFDKIFDNVSSLAELQERMSRKDVKLEVVQVFKDRQKIITLGVFQAPLTSILYPYLSDKSDCGSAEVDLLFECCKPYPGIIAPKAEVSTRAVIEELRLCPKFTDGPVNPTLVSSNTKNDVKRRMKPVCHRKPPPRKQGLCTCGLDNGFNSRDGGGSQTTSSQPFERETDGESSCSSSSSTERLSDDKIRRKDTLSLLREQQKMTVSFKPQPKRFSKSVSNEKRVLYEKESCDCYNCTPLDKEIESDQVPWKVYGHRKTTVYKKRNGDKEDVDYEYARRKGDGLEYQMSTAQTQTSSLCRCNEIEIHKEKSRQKEVDRKKVDQSHNQRSTKEFGKHLETITTNNKLDAERLCREDNSDEMKYCDNCYKKRYLGKVSLRKGYEGNYGQEKRDAAEAAGQDVYSKTRSKLVETRFTSEEQVRDLPFDEEDLCWEEVDDVKLSSEEPLFRKEVVGGEKLPTTGGRGREKSPSGSCRRGGSPPSSGEREVVEQKCKRRSEKSPPTGHRSHRRRTTPDRDAGNDDWTTIVATTTPRLDDPCEGTSRHKARNRDRDDLFNVA